MKKIVCSILIFYLLSFLFSFEIHAQSGWTWYNPYVTGNHLYDVFFTNSNTAFVVGDAGTIQRSTNAGNNWNSVYSSFSGMLKKIFFINEKTGYIVGNYILYTTNAGITWNEQSNPSIGVLNTIFFVNRNVGYAAGDGTIIKTTNSGTNWYWPNTTYPGIQNFLGSHFIDENTGILTGVCSTYVGWPPVLHVRGVYCRTSDGGLNWKEDSLPGTTTLYRVKFNTYENGFILGDGGILFFSSDCGLNWRNIPSDCPGDLTDISFDGVKNGVIVSNNGWIMISTDSGTSWKVRNNVSQTINAVSLKSSTCIIVGPWGLLRNSTDFGGHWINHHAGILPLHDFDIFYYAAQLNINTVLIVGDYSSWYRIFRTTNNGLNWDFQYPPYGLNKINGMKFIDQNTGFMIGDYGFIGKTTNGGLNWDSKSIENINWPINGIFFQDSFTGYICGDGGSVFVTTDAWENWTCLYLNDSTKFKDIYFLNHKTGWVVGDGHAGGLIIHTTNAGLNWSMQFTGISFYTQLNGVYFFNANTGVVAQRDGEIFRTTNGGNNWEVVFNNSYTLNSMAFKDSLNGIVVGGPGGLILRTTNAGLNWYSDLSHSYNELYGCIYSKKYGATAFGSYCTILKDLIIPIGIIGTRTTNELIPKSFSLFQNYPNPFNPTTKIKFSIPLSPLNERGAGGFVTLKIYDLLGREIATLVNEQLKPGTYEVEWDGTNYPSGVYFYRLQTESFSESERMILLK